MIGLDLKLEIVRRGARQFEVARKAKLQSVRLNRILNNRVKPREEELAAIRKALDLDEQAAPDGRAA
jgi:transcriptional regulator with XRE-family HTH domain